MTKEEKEIPQSCHAVDHSCGAMEEDAESEWVLPALTLTYGFIDLTWLI